VFAVNYWQDALRLSVWPHPLLMHHKLPSGNPWVALALQVLLMVAAIVAYSHKRPEFLIGLLFFYLAFLPASRIIGEHGVYQAMTERSIYFPSAGLAILFAGGMLWIANRVGRRYAVASALTIAMVLMPLAWARNAEWVTDVSLGEADYRRGHKPLRVLQALVTDHLKAGNFRRSVEICDQHLKPGETGWDWLFRIKCGEAYFLAGRMNEAEQAYLGAIGNHRGKGRVHYELAVFYLRAGRRSDAKHQFELAIEEDDAPFLREVRTAMMLIQLYPSSRPHLLQARTHLQNTLRLQPQSFQARQALEQLDDRLGL
jgi:tetratricopeptide (TPR) repeat protein